MGDAEELERYRRFLLFQGWQKSVDSLLIVNWARSTSAESAEDGPGDPGAIRQKLTIA